MSSHDTEQLDRLEPAYLANYGLTKSPFSNFHDDAFLYLDAERAQRLNLLQHMTQYGNLLLIVQGERGVGKTSLLTRFIKNAEDTWEICDVTANPLMDASMLMFQIAQGFGLPQLPHDSNELQELLYAHIAKLHHQDEVPILVVDDAHALAKDALLAIFHLADTQVEDANLLRIILFAEPQIEKILNAKDIRSLRERITHTMEIPPLDEDTTAEYLKHRMAVAGFNGGSPFTPKMVKRIYKASAGIPEQINQLAHETLDKGDFEREEVEEIVMTKRPWWQHKTKALIAVAVVVVVLVLVFQNWINRLSEDKTTQTKSLAIPLAEQPPAIQQQAQNAPQQQPTLVPETSQPAKPDPHLTEATQAEKSPVQEKIIPLQSTPAVQVPTVKTQPTAMPSTQQEASPAAVPAKPLPATELPKPTVTPVVRVRTIEPDPVPASNAQQTITVNGEGFTPGTRVFVSWADEDHEIPAERVKTIDATQLQVKLTVGTEHDNWQLHVVDPHHGNSNTLNFHVAITSLNRDQATEWVLSQAPDSFTLQLFGSHDKNNAEAFIHQYKLGKQANYFVSKHLGKDWYSVIYGTYPDQATAKDAIKTLPASLKSVKPWVRRYDDIQANINASSNLKHKQAAPVVKVAPIFTTAIPKHGDEKQNESWIWSQDPSYFTLQLMGARKMTSVKKFLRQHGHLDGQTIYFHTRHSGRDWYAVVFGVYADKQKAREAIKRLPAALQKASPWIRSFASIHAELARTE